MLQKQFERKNNNIETNHLRIDMTSDNFTNIFINYIIFYNIYYQIYSHNYLKLMSILHFIK